MRPYSLHPISRKREPIKRYEVRLRTRDERPPLLGYVQEQVPGSWIATAFRAGQVGGLFATRDAAAEALLEATTVPDPALNTEGE